MQKGASMTFDQMFMDIGQVKKGEKRYFEFPFTNTGTEPLKIDLVSSVTAPLLIILKVKLHLVRKGL